MDQQKIEIRDNDDQKHVLVQVNLKNQNTQVLSNFTAWENIAFLLEALGASAQQCLQDGYSKEEVVDEIFSYLKDVLDDYGVKEN